MHRTSVKTTRVREALSSNLLLVAIAVYSITGVLSPTLVEYISNKDDVISLLPVMANTLGMACMQWLVNWISPASLVVDVKPQSLWNSALRIGIMDLLSASLVTVRAAYIVYNSHLHAYICTYIQIGLVYVGATTFTVIYSSAVSWTAIISWYTKTTVFTRAQCFGVALVTVGLCLNGLGHVKEDEHRSQQAWMVFAMASLALLVGTILHALVMIQMDEYSKRNGGGGGSLVAMASKMGQVEFTILLLWNVLLQSRSSTWEFNLTATAWYFVLTANHLLHSLAFFHMVGRLGAVGSAVLKGFLALATFGLAAMAFCSNESRNQCLTPLKTLSMVSVFAGGLLYGVVDGAAARRQRRHDGVLPV